MGHFVEKRGEAGPARSPRPDLVASRGVLQRGAEHDLRRNRSARNIRRFPAPARMPSAARSARVVSSAMTPGAFSPNRNSRFHTVTASRKA